MGVKKRKLLFFSEMRAMQDGFAGGYSAISEGLATALTTAGHEVKVLGFGYDKSEHRAAFSIIPLIDPTLAMVQLRDILDGWFPDALVVMMDIPNHGDIQAELRASVRYVGVFPVEGGPVLPEWADVISQFDASLTLSEFGLQELRKAGVVSRLLPVGPTLHMGRAKRSDAEQMRKKAFLEDRYIVLKVADNNGRKNWAHTLEFFTRWAKPDCVLYAVTRPNSPLGWHLDALLDEFGGIRQQGTDVWVYPNGSEVRVLGGLRRNDLAWVYNLAAYKGHLLMDTGNEGLGMPILEAFWIGLPVVGMDHTSLTELLANDRGVLFPTGYEYRDLFGNVRRFYPEYKTWAAANDELYHDANRRVQLAMNARRWIEARTWAKAADVLLSEV